MRLVHSEEKPDNIEHWDETKNSQIQINRGRTKAKGYYIHPNLESDNGRVIIIYSKTNTHTRQEIVETPYQESIRLSTRLLANDELIIGHITISTEAQTAKMQTTVTWENNGGRGTVKHVSTIYCGRLQLSKDWLETRVNPRR